MNPILIACAVGIAILSGIVAFLWDQNGALRDNLATERSNVATLEHAVAGRNQAIQDLRIQRVRDEAALQRLNDKMIDATRDREEATARYNRIRSTLDAETLDRPEVVARAARIAIDHSMRAAEHATGGGQRNDRDTTSDRAATSPGIQTSSPGTAGPDTTSGDPTE